MRAVLWVSLVGCTGGSSGDVSALEARVEALEGDRDDLEADLDDALSRIAVLEANDPSTDITALQTGLTAAQGDIDTLEDDLADLQDSWITTDETWTVGPTGDYATLEAAWNAALARRLTPEASVTLSLQDGSHTLAGELSLNHPDGDRINIDGSSQAAVTVTSPEGALRIDHGNHFGRISGITLQGTANEGWGLWVGEGGQVELADATITGFYAGVHVVSGHVTTVGTVTATSHQVGFDLYWGATLSGEDIDAQGNGTGVFVQASQFVAETVNASDCLGTGVLLTQGGIAYVGDLDATSSASGVGVYSGSVFIAGEGTYAGGSGLALQVQTGGYASLGTATISNKPNGVSVTSNGTAHLAGVTFQTVTTPLTTASDAVVIGYP